MRISTLIIIKRANLVEIANFLTITLRKKTIRVVVLVTPDKIKKITHQGYDHNKPVLQSI